MISVQHGFLEHFSFLAYLEAIRWLDSGIPDLGCTKVGSNYINYINWGEWIELSGIGMVSGVVCLKSVERMRLRCKGWRAGSADHSVHSSSSGDLEVSHPFFLWSEPEQENVRVEMSASELKQLSSKPCFSHCLWDLGQVI